MDNRAKHQHGDIDISIEESSVRRQSDELQESEFKLVTARLEHGVKAWRVHEAQSKHSIPGSGLDGDLNANEYKRTKS